MRQYTADFEPSAGQPFDDLWERKLTSVQQVKGEYEASRYDGKPKLNCLPLSTILQRKCTNSSPSNCRRVESRSASIRRARPSRASPGELSFVLLEPYMKLHELLLYIYICFSLSLTVFRYFSYIPCPSFFVFFLSFLNFVIRFLVGSTKEKTLSDLDFTVSQVSISLYLLLVIPLKSVVHLQIP